MTSIVKQLEAAIIAAMEAAVDGAARVSGFRQSVAEGFVKSSDGDGRPEVLVAVSPASSPNYASPVVEFEVNVSVRLEWSDDPTIQSFDEIAALVEYQLHRWNRRENIAAMSSALTTDNFRADGFRLGGGSDTVDAPSDRATISTVFNFAVMGVFTETQTQQENQEE